MTGSGPEMVRASSHPLVATKLTALRDRRTEPVAFRLRVRELTWLLAYEALADARVVDRQLEDVRHVAPHDGALVAGQVMRRVAGGGRQREHQPTRQEVDDSLTESVRPIGELLPTPLA